MIYNHMMEKYNLDKLKPYIKYNGDYETQFFQYFDFVLSLVDFLGIAFS